ncbi:hypothetical protein [Helicobacter pametensis]|uniref:hypothetical protein n=1 Tax=Helicobacter pametensis TaxID=95149 RepID=UPI0004854321|nr:hypothetical protein [Helicobacter pametensis]
MKNILLFLLTCLIAGGLILTEKIDLKSKISLEVLDLFPQNSDRQLLDLYREIGDSNMIFVAQSEGVTDTEFKAFLSEVEALPNIQEVIIQDATNPFLEDFIAQNYFYLGDFTPSKLSSTEIEQKILQDFSQNTLNPSDPLGLIHIPQIQKSLTIHGLPLALIRLKSADAGEVSELYDQFAPLAQRFGIQNYFSQAFVSSINPQLVLKEVNMLGGIAILFFVFLYFLILRIPFLTLNSILTICFSNLLAIMALLVAYPKVSIMSLSFGIGISNICIDYMMHHHFLGYYTSRKIRFNSSVFYGFITTMIGFFICLFVPFPLLNQLALYAIINLGVAYLCFAFLYQNIGFSQPKFYSLLSKIHLPFMPSWLLVLFSLIAGAYSMMHVSSDLDLSKLDYQNKAFETQKEFFAPLHSQQTMLIHAPSINTLIMRAQQVSKLTQTSLGVFDILPSKRDIKARERYFKSFAFSNQRQKLKQAIYHIQRKNPELAKLLRNAYRVMPKAPSSFTPKQLKNLGVEIQNINGEYYTQVFVDDGSKLPHITGVITQQPQDLMQKITSSIYAPMTSILILSLLAMIGLLAIISGRKTLDSISFLLIPLSCILLYLSLTQTPINIMHLFAMLLVVVVSIDYGIYHIKEKEDLKAKHAVLFSTLTTFLSFGLFIFSHTKALNSFGEVVGIGMVCILFLIFFQKDLKA